MKTTETLLKTQWRTWKQAKIAWSPSEFMIIKHHTIVNKHLKRSETMNRALKYTLLRKVRTQTWRSWGWGVSRSGHRTHRSRQTGCCSHPWSHCLENAPVILYGKSKICSGDRFTVYIETINCFLINWKLIKLSYSYRVNMCI